ncbi:hypothetical protein O181_039232 [Austropuccinia psidii MF-1]|uniref:D-isomer specific 2-hydroxyacid dehydrogenase NAD-binding domain-containing protein n=1 Tax=Austropuccinia psidii MF-1 TaxID=1389203 RepID=A0A9Q3DGD3_9BASI|nr:hypothetical protein [Austropuccinia psidii MF-1]
MPFGSARQMKNLKRMLSADNFITIHGRELPQTLNLISSKELKCMKQGSYLINNYRGRVIDIPALINAMESERFLKLPNTILTPHIGGLTEAAQQAIGNEASTAIIRYLTLGSTGFKFPNGKCPKALHEACVIKNARQFNACPASKSKCSFEKRIRESAPLPPYPVSAEEDESESLSTSLCHSGIVLPEEEEDIKPNFQPESSQC